MRGGDGYQNGVDERVTVDSIRNAVGKHRMCFRSCPLWHVIGYACIDGLGRDIFGTLSRRQDDREFGITLSDGE